MNQFLVKNTYKKQSESKVIFKIIETNKILAKKQLKKARYDLTDI